MALLVCKEVRYEGNWPKDCGRDAVEDGLCRPHLNGRRRRLEKAAADRVRRDTRDAQAEYVRAWRAEWPLQTYGATWTCPLCAKVVQGKPYPPNGPHIEQLTEWHQKAHGESWREYEALAAGQQQEGRKE